MLVTVMCLPPTRCHTATCSSLLAVPAPILVLTVGAFFCFWFWFQIDFFRFRFILMTKQGVGRVFSRLHYRYPLLAISHRSASHPRACCWRIFPFLVCAFTYIIFSVLFLMTERGASRYFCHYITGTHSSLSATALPPALVLAVGGIFLCLPLDYSPLFLLHS